MVRCWAKFHAFLVTFMEVAEESLQTLGLSLLLSFTLINKKSPAGAAGDFLIAYY